MVQKWWHKTKKLKKCQFVFLNKIAKNGNGNISVLCYNFWTNQNLDQFRPVKHVKMTVWTLSFVKDEHIYCKKMARNGRNMVIYKGTFVSNQSLEMAIGLNDHDIKVVLDWRIHLLFQIQIPVWWPTDLYNLKKLQTTFFLFLNRTPKRL